jgi:hypothetical protein
MRPSPVFSLSGSLVFSLLMGCGAGTATPGPATAPASTAQAAPHTEGDVAPAAPSAQSDAPMSGGALSFESGEARTRPAAGPAQDQGILRRMERAPEPAEHGPVPRQCPNAAVPVAAPPATGKAPEPAPCYPANDFVERLCRASFPSVALVMFQKGSPWRRGYLRGETKAWTTAPGGQENDRLAQDEEVLILQADASAGGGVQYDAGASFYALRWDGFCVKLTQEELMETVPWAKKTPRLQFGWLDEAQQEALRKDAAINTAYLEQRKQCRGGHGDGAASRCEKLTQQLSDLVVAHVRNGGVLPDPAFRP